MHIPKLFRSGHPVFSIELFPPKTPKGLENLKGKLSHIQAFEPDYISVTYGAGGGTRHNTLEVCSYIKQQLGMEVMAHLTCVSHTRGEIESVLSSLKAEGVDNIMALRGDPPKGEESFHPPPDGFQYASELIGAIKKYDGQGGDLKKSFGIGVAGYPEGHIEAGDYRVSLEHQVEKIRAGGEIIISQFFLENDKFLRWRDDLHSAGVKIPIEAGVLPALSASQISQFSAMNGVKVPADLLAGLERLEKDKDGAAAFGLDFAVKQIEGLLAEGVDGIHLYALNRLEPIKTVAPIVRGGDK